MCNRLKDVIFIVLLASCLQPIEIITDGTGEIVVISGQLSNLEDQSIVTIGITAESERLPFPVSGAVIRLFDGDENVGLYRDDPFIPGRYTLEGYSGIPGYTYHVQVVLPDNRIYESVPEQMPADAGSVSSYYEFVSEEVVNHEGELVMQNFVKIYANSILPSNRFIRWSVEEVYILIETPDPNEPFTPPPCFVTQVADPQSIVLLDRRNLESNDFPNQFLARRLVDESFMLRHYFITYQTALTKEAYDYWRKVEILVGQNGSIFDSPPAKIFGNIKSITNTSEKVFGNFQVSNQAFGRVRLTKDTFPYVLNFNDCIGGGVQSFPLPLRCVSCLTVRNSSWIKPEWFE